MHTVNLRSPDDVQELRVAIRNGVMVSRINRTQLERVRREWARLNALRADARRLGLTEVACVPECYSPYPGSHRASSDVAVSASSARETHAARDVDELGFA